MQVFQMSDKILVSHNGKTATVNWNGAVIPKSWQAKVSKGTQTIVNTIDWGGSLTVQSKTVETSPDGKRLFVNAMMSGITPVVLVALDFVPDSYQFDIKYRD